VQQAGKTLHWRGHVVGCAVQSARQPDDDRADRVILRREAGDFVGHAPRRGGIEPIGRHHPDRPGQRPRRVADGDADAAQPHVEPHDAHRQTLY
jgi:hypothetical protein